MRKHSSVIIAVLISICIGIHCSQAPEALSLQASSPPTWEARGEVEAVDALPAAGEQLGTNRNRVHQVSIHWPGIFATIGDLENDLQEVYDSLHAIKEATTSTEEVVQQHETPGSTSVLTFGHVTAQVKALRKTIDEQLQDMSERPPSDFQASMQRGQEQQLLAPYTHNILAQYLACTTDTVNKRGRQQLALWQLRILLGAFYLKFENLCLEQVVLATLQRWQEPYPDEMHTIEEAQLQILRAALAEQAIPENKAYESLESLADRLHGEEQTAFYEFIECLYPIDM